MRREEVGETDRDAIRQTYMMPEVDENLVGFKIEYCFTYSDDDGTPYDAWCDGVVEKVINEKTRMVLIRWNGMKRKCMKEINLCRDISWRFGAGIQKTPRVGHGESILGTLMSRNLCVNNI
jgi:hypothetical protein